MSVNSPTQAEPSRPEGWEARTRRVREFATVLPLVVILLVMPPIVLVFSAPSTLAGIPLIVVYIYGLWAAAIVAALAVARRLERGEGAGGSEPDAMR